MDRAHILPPKLQVEDPPTDDQIIRQIDPWIRYHLRATIGNVHYENQLYGIFNAYLTSIFPLRRRFMTIPQYMLRKALDPVEIDEYLADVSIGSTGGFFEGRNLPGAENFKLYPDFAVVRVTPQPFNTPRDHRLVALFEIKRDDKNISDAVDQGTRYLEQAQDHPSRRQDLRCYVVLGRQIRVLGMNDRRVEFEEVEKFDIFALGDEFTRALCTVAREEWNDL